MGRFAGNTGVAIHLNTHTERAFYTAFPPERAYIKRIQLLPGFAQTLTVELNIAECELRGPDDAINRLSGQRIGQPAAEAIGTFRIWFEDRVPTCPKQRGVDWQFKIDDAPEQN